jgi:cytochrome P450
MITIPQPNNATSLQALRALLRQRSVLAALEVFHADLGDIFQIPLPGFNPVMLVGPEANRFVLVEQRDKLRWRAEADPVTRLLRHGVLVEDGDSHDDLRRQMNPALHRRMMDRYVEIMWQSSDDLMTGWGNAPLNMLDEMRAVALRILMQSLFSVDFKPDMQRLWRAILKTYSTSRPVPGSSGATYPALGTGARCGKWIRIYSKLLASTARPGLMMICLAC